MAEHDDDPRAAGGCACGGVRYRVDGVLRNVANCHCRPCQQITGNYMAATATTPEALTLTADASLTWYQRTDTVQYGFCRRCGSTLFWRATDKPDQVSIAAGTLEQPTGLTTTFALFTAEAADFHNLDTAIESIPHDRALGNGSPNE